MEPENVKNVIKSLRTYWKGELGIHTHNNLGKAISNSVSALKMELLGLTQLLQEWVEALETQKQNIF